MADFIRMIALSPTMEEGTILKWNVVVGEKITAGKVICEVETDKASMDYEATDDGFLLEMLVKDGDKVKVGDPIAIIGEKDEDITEFKKTITSKLLEDKKNAIDEKKPKKIPDEIESTLKTRIKISPLANILAQNNNLDINNISGSGPGGRIIKEDIEKLISSKREDNANDNEKRINKLTDKKIEITNIKRVMAEKLSKSKFSAPHFYVKIKVICEDLLKARNKLNLETKENKLSLNAFLIKLSAESIKKHPVINSTWMGDRILQHGSIDIGLAVSLEDSLIVPIVKDCGNKGIVQIDAELKSLIDKARKNMLSLDEITGATFTISNLGSYGVDEFTAIINPPGSAILAVGKASKEVIVNEDSQMEIKRIINFTLSCDHRIIDGARAAMFLKTFRENIEFPINSIL
jgi:pyruvate dehydrogenase E2 component (dihydrolipoamide acetyltransferase)